MLGIRVLATGMRIVKSTFLECEECASGSMHDKSLNAVAQVGCANLASGTSHWWKVCDNLHEI